MNILLKAIQIRLNTFLLSQGGHLIATMRVNLYNKIREVMIAYVIKGDCVTLLTIHPLKENQKENRLQTGRWREIK